MSHDKIKAATRRRMAETGEPYTVARRAVMLEHQAAQRPVRLADAFGADMTIAQVLGTSRMLKAHQDTIAQVLGTSRMLKAHQDTIAHVLGTSRFVKDYQQAAAMAAQFARMS